MSQLNDILNKNKLWSEKIQKEDPSFFKKLSNQQTPKILWIGCADSRVPATQICDLDPGEMFVHRNVANLVVHTDINCLSVIQYAVEVLKVTDVIICGHYGCGGVETALSNVKMGLIDNWLRNIKDVIYWNEKELKALENDPQSQKNRLCELNVTHQVMNLCSTTIVQDAWKSGQNVNVHGWIYGLKDGKIKDLGITVDSAEKVSSTFRLNL